MKKLKPLTVLLILFVSQSVMANMSSNCDMSSNSPAMDHSSMDHSMHMEMEMSSNSSTHMQDCCDNCQCVMSSCYTLIIGESSYLTHWLPQDQSTDFRSNLKINFYSKGLYRPPIV